MALLAQVAAMAAVMAAALAPSAALVWAMVVVEKHRSAKAAVNAMIVPCWTLHQAETPENSPIFVWKMVRVAGLVVAPSLSCL